MYAVPGEAELPYLRPSDTLNYLPRAADVLSSTRSANIDAYRLRKGRYKTIYVDRDNGTPILSGGQLLQIRPLNLRHMAALALTDIERYRKAGVDRVSG